MIKAFILSQLRHYAAMAGTSLATYLITMGAPPDDARVVGSALVPLVMCIWAGIAKWNTHKIIQGKNVQIAVLKSAADVGNVGNQ